MKIEIFPEKLFHPNLFADRDHKHLSEQQQTFLVNLDQKALLWHLMTVNDLHPELSTFSHKILVDRWQKMLLEILYPIWESQRFMMLVS